MSRVVALVLVAVVLSGCVSTVEDASAVPEPRKLDCNLIFPGPLDVSP